MQEPIQPLAPVAHPLPEALPAAWLVQAADALALPLAVLKPRAELAFCNVAFQRVLADPAGPLRVQGGCLQATRPGAGQAFAACLAAAAQGERRVLRVADEGMVGSVVPLEDRPPRGGVLSSPRWTLLTLQEGAAPDLDLYAAQCGLSPAETRIFKGLAQGANAAQVAKRFGLKVATVRDHVSRIRHKTGHASPHALLMELAHLPPVLAAEPTRAGPASTRPARGALRGLPR